MGNVRKILCLLLFVMLAPVTLLAIEPTYAQSTPDINTPIPTPSIPEFTIKYVDHSYDVPATTTTHTDHYTGEVTTQIHQGYHVKNFTLDLTIKNQAFPESIDGHVLAMRYHIQTKGYFEQDWHESDVDTQSTSGYTTVAFPANSYPAGGKVDFRVKAWLGYYTPPMSDGKIAVTASFLYPRPSEWSNTQTITIPSSDSSPAPSPTVPELPWFTLLPVCLLVLFAALVLKRKSLPMSYHRR